MVPRLTGAGSHRSDDRVIQPTASDPEAAARYRRGGWWTTEPIGHAAMGTAARIPDAVALIDGEERLTFAGWAARSARLADRWLTSGVRRGDVIAYQLPNWWEAAVVFLAAARIGAVVNPVLPILRRRELGFILGQSGARVLVIPGSYRGCDYPAMIAELRPALGALGDVIVARGTPPQGMQSLDALLDGAEVPAPLVAPSVDAGAVLMLMYTSGTTAEPKGVLHTHQTLSAEVRSLVAMHQLTTADRTLMPSPLTHVSGIIHAILGPALLGTSAVLMDRWDPGAALALIARERVTYMVGAPTFLGDLTDHPDRPRHDLASLRLFSCGGAAVPADLIRRARAQLGCVAKRVYGSTEFPTITTTGAADAAARGIESEGRPIAPNEVRIVGPGGEPRPAEVEGEIQARGPECCVGYADAALSREAFTADGWFRTGDLGWLDPDGYLHVTGRVKDIVIRKGEKFSVRELEELIGRHPGVADVAVVALPDPRTGERACAVVVTRGAPLSLAALAEYLRAQGVAAQKLPEQLEIVSELPRTDSGKIHRAELRARFA